MKSRNIAFDLLKLFAIFLVLWGHCIQHMKVTNTDEPIYLFIYSFHMPLFMMISGYFSISSLQMKFWPFVKKKFIQLLLPCVSWYLLAYVLPKLALMLLHKEGGAFSLSSLDVLLHNFWFLKSVFICYVLAYFGFKGKWIGILLSILISQIIPMFSVSFLYPAFLVGIVLSKGDLLEDDRKRVIIMVSSFLIWAGLLVKMRWTDFNVPISFLISNSELIMDRLLRIFIGSFGALFWISLYTTLFRKSSNTRVASLAKYGKYTLGVYILQTYILESGLCKVISLDKFSLLMSDFIVSPIIALTVLVICILIIMITERYKLMALLLWGYKSK